MEDDWKEDLADMIEIMEPTELGDSVKLLAAKDTKSRNKENKGGSKIIKKLNIFKCDQCQLICNTKDERIQHHILMHQKIRKHVRVVRKRINKTKDDSEQQDMEEEKEDKEGNPEDILTYYCEKCEHRTDSEESLESHKIKEHLESKDSNNENVQTTNKQNLDTFNCNTCMLNYTLQSSLTRHNKNKH